MTPSTTACILCSQNCGILVEQDEQGKFGKIIGDPEHPVSEGYLCQKATRLNYYQEQERLTSPLRKKADGSFEEISWDIAIQEIAQKLVHIRNTHGGTSIAFAGGGGQGNHLGGVYGAMLRLACETPYVYTALAHVYFLGTNPVQSHGIPKARPTVNEIARNPEKTLVVIDVRRTETAKKADIFLQVKLGKDAYLLAAILGHIVQNGLEDQEFKAKHTVGFDQIKPHLMQVPIAEYAAVCGVDEAAIVAVAKGIAAAKTFALRSDLGIEQSHNSTLNAYLARLLFLVTGNFGKEGTNCLHTMFFPLVGHSKSPEEGGIITQVTGMRGIGKLFPPNILPLEINTDHPKRLRALIVDSANPVANYADAKAQRAAIEQLELSVVVDVAMTETARAAQYVLPARNQFEKIEATFFN